LSILVAKEKSMLSSVLSNCEHWCDGQELCAVAVVEGEVCLQKPVAQITCNDCSKESVSKEKTENKKKLG
jgi:hypothetical protein